MAFIEASLEELPVSANLGQSCLATKISAPGPNSFGWFRHRAQLGEYIGYHVVVPKDVMEFQAVEVGLELANLLALGIHLLLGAVPILVDLLDDVFGVAIRE